jgi:hypothetical protein
VTYHQLPHILHQPGGKDVEETIHAQLPNLREVYQVIALSEEARRNNSKQTAEQENSSVSALARRWPVVVDDLDLVAGLLGLVGALISGR